MAEKETYYMIRLANGQFSAGGRSPSWGKAKRWSNIGHVKSHLKVVRGSRYRGSPSVYDGAVIVKYEVEPRIVEEHDLNAYFAAEEAAKKAKEDAKKAREAAARKASEEAAEKALLKRLKQKYPDG